MNKIRINERFLDDCANVEGVVIPKRILTFMRIFPDVPCGELLALIDGSKYAFIDDQELFIKDKIGE